MSTVEQAIKTLDAAIGDPCAGLPDEVFRFASGITPLINVDLLIKDADGRTLLTWRDDGFGKPGWHIPGGIIRFKEPISARIREVARTELGAEVEFESSPLALHEIIHPERRVRGHFISLLYRCSLTSPPDEQLRYGSGAVRPNQWKWHAACPDDMIAVHRIYGKYF